MTDRFTSFADLAALEAFQTREPEETGHAGSATATVLDNMRLFGPGRIDRLDDAHPDRDFAAGAAGVIDHIRDLFEGGPLEAHLEDVAWGVVHAFYRKIGRIDRDLDGLGRDIGKLARTQDGSEIASVELETLTARAHALEEDNEILAEMFSGVSAAFREATGTPWRPARGSRAARGKVTSAILDARDLQGARARKAREALSVEGPRVLFAGGADWTDVDAVFAELDRVRERHPDMVLIHGGQRHGAELFASRWADARGVAQIVFAPEFGKHGRAAPFKRNDAMLDAEPVGAVIFPGNGITLNMRDKAIERGVPVHACGFARKA